MRILCSVGTFYVNKYCVGPLVYLTETEAGFGSGTSCRAQEFNRVVVAVEFL